jgi:hypothetical protein
MVLDVRIRLAALMLAAAVGVFAAPGLAAARKHPKPVKKTAKGPTAAQIRAAVAGAARSPDLWATVNVCTSSPGDDEFGVRGEMPSLGFSTTLLMYVSVSYWNFADNMFESDNASSTISLGKGTHGLHQGGVNFPFTPPPMGSQYLLRATVTFKWRIGTKVLGTVTRNTGHGYMNVGYSDPAGYNSGTCTLT